MIEKDSNAANGAGATPQGNVPGGRSSPRQTTHWHPLLTLPAVLWFCLLGVWPGCQQYFSFAERMIAAFGSMCTLLILGFSVRGWRLVYTAPLWIALALSTIGICRHPFFTLHDYFLATSEQEVPAANCAEELANSSGVNPMKPAPKRIGNARVVCYSPIDHRHRATGNCRQIVAGVLQGPAAGLAICQYDGESSYYLFGCDDQWQSVTDTCHVTMEAAKGQAEFEYEGVTATWITLD